MKALCQRLRPARAFKTPSSWFHLVVSLLPLGPPRSVLLIKPGLLIRPDLIYYIGGETQHPGTETFHKGQTACMWFKLQGPGGGGPLALYLV